MPLFNSFQLCCVFIFYERFVYRPDGFFEIIVHDADDDIVLVGALVDDTDIYARFGQRSKESCRYAGPVHHAFSDCRYQRYIFKDFYAGFQLSFQLVCQLADACNLNRSYLADIEQCNRNFGIASLSRIVEGLGMTFAEFFSDE